MERQAVLRRVLFLKTVPDSAIAEVAAAAEVRSYRRGELIFPEKGRCIGLIIVVSGSFSPERCWR